MTEPPNTDRSIDLSVEVPGTPEQVWDAIATGAGISAWMHPTSVDEHTGGRFCFDMGAGPTTGTVTAWEPPRHFGQVSTWSAGDDATAEIATEWLVEARDGGTCIVRLVMSGFGSSAAWDDEIEGMASGLKAALESLRHHLTHAVVSPEAAVRAVLVNRLNAFNRRDADAFVALYAPGCVGFELAPPLAVTGMDADAMREWFASFEGPLTRDVRNLRIDADRELAVSHSLTRLTSTKVGAGEERMWYRETLAFRRLGERWFITHEHVSTPSLMDGSGRAALDLEP